MADRGEEEKTQDGEAAHGVAARSLEGLSLGGVAEAAPQCALPKKYRMPVQGERSTFQGAGLVPVCRLPNGEVRILLWQSQQGKKTGVRWWDFGGKKESKEEFTSHCACRRFAKQTYGIFGTDLNLSSLETEKAMLEIKELYVGLCNLPLMCEVSKRWAQLQLTDDNTKLFYHDKHEYHTYLMNVPYIGDEILTAISEIVDGGKRVFKWLGANDFKDADGTILHGDV